VATAAADRGGRGPSRRMISNRTSECVDLATFICSSTFVTCTDHCDLQFVNLHLHLHFLFKFVDYVTIGGLCDDYELPVMMIIYACDDYIYLR
jgi:hypothetical protein